MLHFNPKVVIEHANLSWTNAILLCFAATLAAQTTFTDVPDAIAALLRHPHDQRTVQYLSAHSPESVPLLMQIVENQQTGWVYANSGLIRMNDSRLGPFYIRLLHDNLYLKEADGSLEDLRSRHA